MKNINKSFHLSLLFGLWIWVFLKIWLTCAIIAVCAIAFATASFASTVTVAILFCAIGLSAVAKIILEIDVWSIRFFRECERIFLNYLIDSLRPVHVIMVVFATIAQTSLNIVKLIPHHTFFPLQSRCNTFWDTDFFGSCSPYTLFPFQCKRRKGLF